MDKTKAKIQELVPEIMELKFGCRVQVYIPSYGESNESVDDYVEEQWGIATYIQEDEPMTFLLGEHIYDVYASDFKDGDTEYVDDEDGIVCTNVGRPITLADVLLAIGQSKEYYTGIDATGEFIQAGEFGGMNRTNIMWDLTKTYDDQSQETKDFIGQILGVK